MIGYEKVALAWMYTAMFALLAYKLRQSDLRTFTWAVCGVSAFASAVATLFWLGVMQ